MRVADILRDPCNGNIPDSVFGESSGYTLRVRSTLSMNPMQNAAYTCGYVVWFPEYHTTSNATTVARSVSFVQFSTGDSTLQPVSVGFGAATPGSAVTTAFSREDPAYQFVNSTVAQDARTLAACMKVRYVGTTSSAAGSFYPLTNVPLELLTNDRPSVDRMIAYSTSDVRAIDSLEVKSRPTSASGFFHKPSYGPLIVDSDAHSAINSSCEAQAPVGIGFVYYNVDPDELILDLYKIIEWKPEVGTGIPGKPIVGGFTRELVSQAVTYLDRRFPKWDVVLESAATHQTTSLANMLRRVVLGGARG